MITSTSNPRVKALARLKRRSDRDRTGTFPIEGRRAVERALEAGWPLTEGVVAPHLANADAVALAGRVAASGVPVTELGAAAYGRIAYRKHPDGILVIGRTRTTTLDDLSLPEKPLLLVVEASEKPGNLGAMLRTADGAGVHAVIAADAATDVFNPNVVRASQGALFSMPMVVAGAPEVASWIQTHGISAVAASPSGTIAPWETDLSGACAIVIGSEHAGLSAVWNYATAIRIPMRGKGDSLNASTAAAILVYEAIRQRG